MQSGADFPDGYAFEEYRSKRDALAKGPSKQAGNALGRFADFRKVLPPSPALAECQYLGELRWHCELASTPAGDLAEYQHFGS